MKPGKNYSVKKLTLLALMTTIALAISVLESAFPPLVPIPGVKLGLANIITLVLIINRMPKEAAAVLFMRIFLASLFAGQMMSFFFSLLGGGLCLIAMYLTARLLKGRPIWFISIIGAIFHNIGQIAAALITLQSIYVLYYFPFLLVSGIITGFFTGLCVYFFNKRIPDLRKFF